MAVLEEAPEITALRLTAYKARETFNAIKPLYDLAFNTMEAARRAYEKALLVQSRR